MVAPPQPWAVNIHGFLSSGDEYCPESDHLSSVLGWNVVTPTLPDLSRSAGSHSLTLGGIAEVLAASLDRQSIDRSILIGHSMGAAVAIAFASRYPERTLGVIYRDGCGTPAWRRFGLSLGPASVVETLEAIGAGRFTASLLAVPKLARLASPSSVALLGSLLTTDLTADIAALAAQEMPLLCMWGQHDHVVPRRGAHEFSRAAGVGTVWVPGGHVWMQLRPETQAQVLREHPLGREFVERVNRRHLEPLMALN